MMMLVHSNLFRTFLWILQSQFYRLRNNNYRNLKVNKGDKTLYKELFEGVGTNRYTLRFPKPSITTYSEEYGEYKEDSREYVRELPTMYKHMYLQSWIFSPTKRNEQFMLLWPWQWDYIPPIHPYHPSVKVETTKEEWVL